ncbi:MAG: DUF6174 domain-containing protein [Gemmataceae bacterium]|nr:DUF6174 domain-containing protein [Gemmataceae bacterium]
MSTDPVGQAFQPDTQQAGQAGKPDLPRSQAGKPDLRPAKRNRGWLWYFLVVVVLAVGAAVTLVVYNLGQQLTPEKLEAAHQLWEQKGPKDYEFRYTVRAGGEQEVVNRYAVVVRGGKVRSVTLNEQIQLPANKLAHHSMDRLFDDIERFLILDRQEKRRVFQVAMFDPKDGHLIRFVRRVTATSERQEIKVEQFRALDKPSS